jgi:acetylornithine deacetylase/succinyl-diaminopimelate desuccinylase-like protein
MIDPSAALAYASQHRAAFLKDYKALLRIPSVSTQAESKPDMIRAASWIADQLKELGFDAVQIFSTGGHPVVYGQRLQAGENAPTILFYGHYDVQPTDPIDLWHTDPFEPTERGENLYARGASDMKGQLVAHLKALESMLHSTGIPVNLKYMVEGEEEIGSPNLGTFIDGHHDLLKCDACLNADSGILGADVPAITYALRGLAYFELRLQGAAGDLHSGTYGGAVENPANVLVRLLAGMKDSQHRVTFAGFYDDVRQISDEERRDLANLPQTDEWWKKTAGVKALDGEVGFSVTERATARPTLDINGLLSGFTSEGSETVLPARAMAKFSMRLVPDQNPARVRQMVDAYLEANIPETISWELLEHSGCTPAITERDSEVVAAASRALEQEWGKSPLFSRAGGSVPVVSLIRDKLQVDTLLLGFALPDDNIHAPNEKQHLPTFYRGINTYIRFMNNLVG